MKGDIATNIAQSQVPKPVRLRSFMGQGITHRELLIEALVVRGNQSIQVSGLADATLKESIEKVRNLLRLRKLWRPTSQILINLLPPELPKSGSHLELPIYTACLLALLQSQGLCEGTRLDRWSFAGAINLDGSLAHTDYSERLAMECQELVGADFFADLPTFEAHFFSEKQDTELRRLHTGNAPALDIDIAEVRVDDLDRERFWLIIAGILQSPVLLLGSPGAGKSHLARWAHTLMPKLSEDVFQRAANLWKSAGLELSKHRPLLCPHSRSHFSDFIGTSNSTQHRPGIYALSHQGLLILDEFHELNRDCRELLRNVLDERKILRHTRAGTVLWPADFWLILTANPCECGFAMGKDLSKCLCSQNSLRNYRQRLSGPLLDRMGIKLFMSTRLPQSKLAGLYCRLSKIPPPEIRQAMIRWQSKIPTTEEAAGNSLGAASKRESSNLSKIQRALRSTDLFSEAEISSLLAEYLEHQREFFGGQRS